MPGIGIGISSAFLRGGKESIDPDALTYINAAGITTAKQIRAVNRFVKALKQINGIQANFANFASPNQSVIKALYPFVGGSAAINKPNLINPANTNAAYRLDFFGTFVHDVNGILPDGVSAYARTFLVPAADLTLNDTSFFYYALSNPTNTGVGIGSRDSSAQASSLSPFHTSNKVLSAQYNTNTGQGFFESAKNTVQLTLDGTVKQALAKFVIGNKTATKHQIYINGALDSETANSGGSLTTFEQYLFTLNNAGTPVLFTSTRCGLIGIGKSMTNAAAIAFSTAVANFQKDLGRYRYNTLVNCIGDSITYGLSSPNVNDYPKLLRASFSFPSNLLTNNFGVSGRTLATMITAYAANEATYYNSLIDNNDLVLLAGVNDLGQDVNLTKETLLGMYKTYLNAANATGFNCFICQLLPQSNPSYAARASYEADRQWLNGMMITDLLANGYVKGVVPIGSDARIGVANAQMNPTYFITNGATPYIHPNDAGNAVLCELVRATLVSYHKTNI